MEKYRNKSVVIKAIEWTGKNKDEIIRFIPDSVYYFNPGGELIVHYGEGGLRAIFGDFIIKGVAGEFYTCTPEEYRAKMFHVKQKEKL